MHGDGGADNGAPDPFRALRQGLAPFVSLWSSLCFHSSFAASPSLAKWLQQAATPFCVARTFSLLKPFGAPMARPMKGSDGCGDWAPFRSQISVWPANGVPSAGGFCADAARGERIVSADRSGATPSSGVD